MTPDPAEILRRRLEVAIGGRDKALSVEKASAGRFRRKRLQSWIDGDTSPPVDELVELAKFLRKAPDFFLSGSGAGRADVVSVQKLDVCAAAGGGAVNHLAKVEETLEFPRWMAKKLARNVSRLRLLRAAGDSMEPTIRNGALLLVDEGDRDLPKTPPKPKNPWDHPDIYVFTQGEEVRVKRLRQDKKGLFLAISDNPAHGPEILHRQDFKIEGRVVWWDNWL